jgi:hypothetical protein
MRLSYRQAAMEDWPAIQKLHAEHQRAQVTNYELPWLNGPSILIVLVAVDEHGAIRGCLYCESVAELRLVGCDPKATALFMRQAPDVAHWLKARGYRWWECFVPRKLARAIGKPLRRAGFECVDHELAHFTRDLREK